MPEDDAFPNPGAPTPPHEPDESAWNVESLIGSRVLLGAGLLSLLAGAAFFVKLSNDQQWIPPQVRVLCGLVAGLVLLLGGTWQLGKQRTLVAEGLTGLGASVLYLALWGAYGPFALIRYELAFPAMIAICVALALVAWRRNSQNVALAGLAGGYLTPILLQTDALVPQTLAVYLAVLCGVMLALAVRCRYRLVEAASFGAALLYAPVFAPSHGAIAWTQNESLATATILFAEFIGALFFIARRDGHVDRYRIGLVVAEVVAYLGVLELELGWDQHTLALADAALAAVLLLAVAFRVPATLRATYVWLGLGVLTRAVEVWGGSHALTATLAVEGAGLVFVGVRNARPRLRQLGYALLACGIAGAGVHLVVDEPARAILNDRTWTVGAVIAALLLVLRDLRSYGPLLSETERDGFAPLTIVIATGLAVAAASSDAITATAHDGAWTEATQTALSALWSVAATLLVTLGFRYRSPLTRWLGIGLFTVAIAKVFTIDLLGLDVMARVISALVLGAVLVVVAAGYQMVMLRGRRLS